ncbi:MAG: hypothetical protein LBK54_02710 [Propionibacteriaceae bacterium]|nr:hypothetical protein [Propionibacteriaceae bacterium]
MTENDYANFLIRLSNYSGPIATQVERLAAAAKPNLTDHWAVMSGLLGLDMIKVVLGKRVEIAKIDYRSMHHVVRLGRKYKIRYSDAYVLTWAWLENATIVGLNPSPDLVRVGQRIGVEIYTLPHLPD